MNDSNTQHLSDLIKMFYERTKGPDYQYEVRIVQSWEKVVGKFIASHTTDIFIRNGILHVRINRKQFEAFCSDIGMTMTTAFCVFAKAAVRKQKIPFEISTDPFYSESNMAHLRRGIEALNAGKWVEHELIEAGE